MSINPNIVPSISSYERSIIHAFNVWMVHNSLTSVLQSMRESFACFHISDLNAGFKEKYSRTEMTTPDLCGGFTVTVLGQDGRVD